MTRLKTRIWLLKVGFSLFALVIILRAAFLASGVDTRLANLSSRQFKSNISILPRRGLIFDRNGEGLASSLKVRSLFVRPEKIPKDFHQKISGKLSGLARILEMPPSTLKAKLSSDKAFVWVKRQLTAQMERDILDMGIVTDDSGFGLAEETQRFYPNRDLAAHVLGSVGVDGQGLEGLELLYEHILKGETLRISSTKDAMGRRIFKDEHGLLALGDGQSLILTLDKSIQYETEKVLSNVVNENRARAGIAIVSNIRTGEILALANIPTYDPNRTRQFQADQRRNRAITDTYEPGSTFKPFILGLALERGKTPRSRMYCEEGRFEVEDRVISEAETHEKYGSLTYAEILKFSSNIGTAKIALEMGSRNISQLLERLQIEKKTGVDLPGEVGGYYKKEDLNSSVLQANIGFGQGLSVTALQMISYYAAIANGGYWVQPRLVKAVLSEDPDSLQSGLIRYKLGAKLEAEHTRRIFSEPVSKGLTQMLQGVVEGEGGTGTAAALEEWSVAGKTGTAQKIDPRTRRYSHEKYVATFVGFAPAENPRLAVLVLLDEPTKKYYAGVTAAPAFREIMKFALLRERTEPSKKTLFEQNKLAIKQLPTGNEPASEEKISAIKKTPEPSLDGSIPDFKGKTLREVLRQMNSTSNPRPDYKLEIIRSGNQPSVVKEQTFVRGRLRLVFKSEL